VEALWVSISVLVYMMSIKRSCVIRRVQDGKCMIGGVLRMSFNAEEHGFGGFEVVGGSMQSIGQEQ